MREKIPISKTTKYILVSIFSSIILIVVLFFTRNWFTWKEELKYFKSIKINSRILELKELNRGNYQVKLGVKDTLIEFALPISFEVKRDNIQVGDSLSKNENSELCEIFRLDRDGKAQMVSEFTIY